MPALKRHGASIISRPKGQFSCLKLSYDEDGDLKSEQRTTTFDFGILAV